MKHELQKFNRFLKEAKDPAYYQDTFYFTILISMNKDVGGSRDETKNDIRALPEILTVTLVEPEKGGIQRDLGTKYLSTLKVHTRKPKDISKEVLMKRLVANIGNLRGVSVLRYKERKPKQRKKAFQGAGSYVKRMAENGDNYQGPKHRRRLKVAFKKLTGGGPQKTGGAPFNRSTNPDWKSAPPGAPGGLEEAHLEEAMKTARDLPEGVVVVVLKESDSSSFQVYYALREDPKRRLKAGDLDRMEAGIDIYGLLRVSEGRNDPYEGVYIVTSAKAKDGFGPLLYDVALEVAGKSGLKPDTLDVSDDASAVWKHYDTQREDVDSKMLVMDTDEFELVMPEERAEDPGTNEHLAQAYFKKGKGTTKELIDQNKFIELNPNVSIPDYSPRDDLKDLAGELDIPIVKNTDLSRYDRLREDVRIAIADEDFSTFGVREELNQRVWDGDTKVRPEVKAALMEIVQEFMDGLDLGVEPEDIIITGSLANYNWSKFSDIDLHIIVDFADINDNEEMVKKFFDAVRSNWNKLHNIMVKDHEVEIYLQDAQEPHVSTGVYSLIDDRWLVKPNPTEPEIDEETALKKMKGFAREVDKLVAIYARGAYEEAFAFAERLKEKLKRMRRGGLETGGVYSPENIAFKMLRRSGDIEQLFDTYTRAYDKIYSLDQ
jgi:hypothetical protein|tara:strand:- start:1200 stop:3179 length:1980 start_codon:yes stop_codon:yes gene_type:complete